jgi:hypothetical protein
MARGARNPWGSSHGVVGYTHNTNTMAGKTKGQYNPQGVSGTQPKTPIKKTSYNILEIPSKVDSIVDAIIGSLASKSLNPKNQCYP